MSQMTSTFEWRASFVGPAGTAQPGDPAPYFRREFTVDDGLQQATASSAVSPPSNPATGGCGSPPGPAAALPTPT
jgi:hypothetical protein